MRVLYLADAVFQDLPGGSKMVAWELARGMVRRGHHATFLVPTQTENTVPEEEIDGIHIVRYPGGRSPVRFVLEGRAACARLWARKPFDVVHTHFAYAGLGPLEAVPPAVPRIRTFHGFWDEEGWVQETRIGLGPAGRALAFLRRPARARIEDNDLRHSDAVVVLSEYSARLLHARGASPSRIHMIPPGVDAGRFVPTPDRSTRRHGLGLPTDRRILLTIRRLVPRMGLDNLIQAMPAVVARHPDALLLIGGQGPERARLEALVTALDLDGHVRLVGFVPDDRLAAFYQAADLFVLPTVALEGFGLVILEALACGVPVIGTPVGAIPEILNEIDPRLVSDDATPAALAGAVCRFWEEDWGRGLIGTRLRDDVCRRFSWEARAAKVEGLYFAAHDRPTAKASATRRLAGSL